MQKKDLWLFVLILVIGAITAIRQPLFLSPINIANTANLVGLFGIFSIGQGFVIITGGIELSVGSIDRAPRRDLRRLHRQQGRPVAAGGPASAGDRLR